MQAALIVLDGWGCGNHNRLDAISAAATPVVDKLISHGMTGTLDASGQQVGLPDGQMGNSEVGHLTIGAGRVIPQSYTRINDAISDNELKENEAIASAFDHANTNDGRIHYMGLASDGGVHSDVAHLHALIEIAADKGISAVTHGFTDGRDTPPKSAIDYLRELQSIVDEHGTGDVVSIIGRYYAMDRDENWERTKQAYDAIVNRETEYTAETPVEAIEASYERGDTDEFVEPTLITDHAHVDSDDNGSTDDVTALADGDSVVFFNFRADRARQLVRLLADIDPERDFTTDPPEIQIVTMTEYDREFDVPVAFPPHEPEDTLGETLSAADLTQLRIAESEKYPHVTYFLNGGREVEFDGESREIVESPDVSTYDQQPEMSAIEVTDTAIDLIGSEDPDILVLNYANPDMVGHTGDYEATITAVEAVDTQLGRLVDTIQGANAHLLVTADHGNAEDMGTSDDPDTTHTNNPVPISYLGPDGTDNGRGMQTEGELADIAPTLLALIDVDRPDEMTGTSLLD